MTASKKATVLRGHHLNVLHHVLRGTDAIIQALGENGYKKTEAMRPAVEQVKALRENQDALVRFQLGHKDILCESCSGARRCPDNPGNKIDNKHIDRAYLRRSDIKPGKNYTVGEILRKIEERLSAHEYL